MRKLPFVTNVTKAVASLLLMLVFLSQNVNAQIDISIGTGTVGNTTTTYPCPIQDFYEGSRAQYLYRASELNAAGMGAGNISAIKFNVTSIGTAGIVEQYTIKIGGSAVATLNASTWEPGLATRFGPVNYQPVVGINTFTLTTPFFWNGTDNLIIEICNGDPNSTAGITYTQNAIIPWTTGLSFTGSHSYRADNLDNLCATTTVTENGTGTTRPNITFGWTPATTCSGAPAGGTAVTSLANILCAGAPFTLSATGATVASGLTYQWQSSTDNATWTNISGATTASITTTQTATSLYYRRIITCTSAAQSANSTSVLVTSVSGPVYATLPYAESFENNWINSCGTRDVPNTFWKNTPTTGNASWRRNDDGVAGASWVSDFGLYNPSASAGSFSARMHSYDMTNGETNTFDLFVNCNTAAAEKRLVFDFINTSGTDTLSILLSTDGGTTFTRLDSTGLATAWRTKTIFFNTLSSTAVIRFRGTGDFGVTDIGLDNIRLTNFGNCTGTPTGGTASATPLNVCLGESIFLNVVGSTDANGITYQWQVSTNGGTTWTNIAGATNFASTTTQSATSQYRCIITCTNGGASATSTPVTVNSPTLVGGTFTINSAVATGGTNFQSFNDAYNYIKCGIGAPVVFNVAAASGPYNEQLIMAPVPGASATNTVTFNGNGRTISFLSTNTNERAIIKLNGADFIRFNNLVITATGTTTTQYGFGVQLLNNADNNSFTNCTINVDGVSTSTNYAGIVISASATSATTTGNTLCDNNIFNNNTINGGYYAFTLVGSSTSANANNQITNNTFNDFYFYGLYVNGSFNTLIEGNTIARNTRTAVSTFYGIYYTGLSLSTKISKNRITNPFGGALTSTSAFYGIYFTACDAISGFENEISNNVIYNVTGSGDQYGIYNSSSDNLWAIHNTISLDNTASTATATYVTRGYYQITQADGLIFYNNIVTIGRGGASGKNAIYLATATSSILSNRNDFFISATAGINAIGFINGANRTTLQEWQNASNGDLNSISANPIYTNIATGDLKPTNAVIDNRGLFLDITDDIANVTRSTSTPDVGAWEFTPPPCVTPPTPGTATVSVNPVCANFPVTVGLNGYSVGLTQTYQWQTSTTLAGTYIDFGTPLTNPDTVINPITTLYYRCVVKCGVVTAISTPILLTVTPALPQGTYTINKNVAASATNFISFNAAYNAMSCGIAGPVVFNVVSGTGPYTEQLIIDTIAGTSSVNTITFNGNGNTLAFASANTNERAVIKIRKADYITFDSLTIDASAGTFGFGVHLLNNADSNTIKGCTVLMPVNTTSTNFAGLVISASDASATTTGASRCDGNVFDNNRVVGGYYSIVNIGGVGAEAILNNKITRNRIEDFYFYGIYTSYSNGQVIEENRISRPTRTTLSTFYGIYATTGTVGSMVSKNRIFNPAGGATTNTSTIYGIYHTGADGTNSAPNIVSNNAIYNINGGGAIYGIYNGSSDNTKYYHNTISIDNTANTSTNLVRAFYQITEATGIDFNNNIISIRRGGTGIKHAMYFGTATSVISADRNNYFVPASANNFIGFAGADRVTLAAWQTATSLDANTKTIDPTYVDAINGNLTPGTPASAIDNLGTPVGITTDIVNATRSTTTPDPGAYEFAIPNCVNPIVAGTSTAIPNSNICMGTNIGLNISGNTFGAGQSYQWQSSTTLTGTYTNVSPVLASAAYTTPATVTTYYRCAIICNGGSTVFSTPVLVTLNPAFVAGTYTINPAAPISTTNFQTFNGAVNALYCGITGHVVFNVATGTYVEQVRIGNVPGSGANATVTFQAISANNNDVKLTFAGTTAANYTLKFDTASYFNFKRLSIENTTATAGRVVEVANRSSFDSVVNCNIIAPSVTTATTDVVGVYANNIAGSNLVLKGNTITNGSSGVYITGTSVTELTANHTIDSNTVVGSYANAIYTNNTSRIKINKNTITIDGATPKNNTVYGIYAGYADSAFQANKNNVTITNTSTAVYGVYSFYSDATQGEPAQMMGNIVRTTGTNAGTIYGLGNYFSTYVNTINNVVSIATTGSNSYALYSYQDQNVNYWNNSIRSSATSATNNHAGYFYHTAGIINVRNNIFSHNGGGRAMYVYNPNFHYSDYNMLFTTGTNLVQVGTPAANFTNLQAWRNTYNWDESSIVFAPSFAAGDSLRPNVTDPNVWAIHGRGVQIEGNEVDFNNNTRPVTFTAGVPDLGAYEFVPTSIPPAMVATPATPVANGTQTYSFGTDTVARITWGATVPTTTQFRRYSGVVPPNLPASSQYMYFYTDMDVTGAQPSAYTMRQFYIDSWRGFIPQEQAIRMGRTDAANNWGLGLNSTLDNVSNVITENNLAFIDKFTGLTNASVVIPPTLVNTGADSSNKGTSFWTAYANSFDFTSNLQNMVIYLSTDNQPAVVTVRVNGTNWTRTYNIPANTAIASEIMPKTGLADSRLLVEGKSTKGISIESSVPITAYAHIYYSTNSGATLLLPTGTYGYEYYTLNSRQNYTTTNSHSSFFVVASQDNTVVEITPSNPTFGGRAANVPFIVNLNRGEVYQVLGAYISGSEGYDLSGSRVKALPNADGKCFAIAVFAGSTRTGLGCGTTAGGSGDLLFQQVFPSQAWGSRYLTAPTSTSGAANSLMTNMYRILVKDPTTVVSRNGVVIPPASIINGRYYAFESNTADYITSTQPIMVAQYMSSSGSCPNTSGDGDPELFYLSPIEQAIKESGFYRNNLFSITSNYLTVVVPTAGIASLRIDGTATFDHSYPHPNLAGYTVVVRRWAAGNGQSRVKCDSAFTGIVYGLGSVESYGYNVGTLVKNLNAIPSINNTLSSISSNDYTCAKAPFRFNVLLPVKPTLITWNFSALPSTVLSPNTDVTQANPVAIDSVVINGRKFFKYTVPADYVFNDTGNHNIPFSFVHPSIEGCNSRQENFLKVRVIGSPISDFTTTFTNCVGDVAQFGGLSLSSNNVVVNRWNWEFPGGVTSTTQNPTHTFNTAGTYNIKLRSIALDGCVGDTIKPIVVNPRPTVTVVPDSIAVCAGQSATFNVNPAAATTTYNWFSATTGGTALATGASFVTPAINATTPYFVAGTALGCTSTTRTRVVATVLPKLATPVVSLDSAAVNSLRFKWAAVPGAATYQVSRDGGTTWVTPTSGATGLTHTITGLLPLQSITLTVRAIGAITCQTSDNGVATAKTLPDQVYIPNAFSPNGDGNNDVLRVYGYVIKDMQFMVFNQWGEKVFESRSQAMGWDGKYKGKTQPAGVYIYVGKFTLNDGTTMERKGSLNLIK